MAENLKYLITGISILFLIFLISFSFINQLLLTVTVFAQISNDSIINENKKNMDKINSLLTQNELLGIVKNGTFIEVETKLPLTLIETEIQEAVTPYKLDLTEYEGKAILVSTQLSNGEPSGWGTKITEVATPLLTKVIKKVFTLENDMKF